MPTFTLPKDVCQSLLDPLNAHLQLLEEEAAAIPEGARFDNRRYRAALRQLVTILHGAGSEAFHPVFALNVLNNINHSKTKPVYFSAVNNTPEELLYFARLCEGRFIDGHVERDRSKGYASVDVIN